MKVVLTKAPGGPEQLYLGEHQMPTPGDEELLVRVQATAVNRADLMQREGKYPPPEGASEVLGLEIAGRIEAKGAACDRWSPGDRVFGLLAGGGYAEYAVIHQDLAMRVPSRLSIEEAAAIPEVFLTAFQALYWLGELQPDQHVLIHAGASGVGTAAIQLVRQAGGHAYVTASAPKHERCLSLGAEVAINYKNEDFDERIEAVTKGRGVDLILDFIGAPYFAQNIQSLALDGRIVLLSTLGGSHLEAVDLRTLFWKRARIEASTLRSRSLTYKIDLTQDFSGHCLPLFETGRLRPVIDSIYDWTEVQAAHRYMGENKNIGKLVLRVM
ncbi:MAG: NAD(P)H-quinone oxidoreductase [Rhodothermales bacterium]